MKLTERKTVLYCAGHIAVMLILLFIRKGGMTGIPLLSSVLLVTLSYIAMIFDLNTKRIPNMLVVTMVGGWLLLMVTVVFVRTENIISILTDSMYGFLTGGGLFLLVYILSRKGLGGGDVKFIAAAGLYLGFAGIIPAILYGSVLAALTGLILVWLKKLGRKDTMPLVPFLFIGIMVTVITR